MPYNAQLEQMIEAGTVRWSGKEKKKLFGGVCYLLNGNMAFGIWKDYLIVRLCKEEAEKRLNDTDTRPFDITGKPMAGWVMVKESGWKRLPQLKAWLGLGRDFALSLPEKESKGKAKKKKPLKEYKG